VVLAEVDIEDLVVVLPEDPVVTAFVQIVVIKRRIN
jgi:hypothetical protein